LDLVVAIVGDEGIGPSTSATRTQRSTDELVPEKQNRFVLERNTSIHYNSTMSLRIDNLKIINIKFLRGQGYSLPEISNKLNVSKSSVLRYIKDVEILPEYLSDWAGKRGGSRKKRLLKEAQAFEEGKNLVDKLSKKDKMLYLSALYWAEGTKKDFSLSNTDPNLIFVFVKCLRDVFDLDDSRLLISVRIYEDIDKDKSLEFWARIVGISKDKMRGVNIINGSKLGKLEYGMCRVRISKGGDILKKIKGINSAVFESLMAL
jgi:hypothetical protein